MTRTIAWFSCGAASALAAKLTDSIPVYCETGAEHPDNERFLRECEQWFGRSVTRIKSERYSDTWDVWTRCRYLSGINGARCTAELKFKPRIEFQRPDDIHVFGYTADGPDVRRADTLRKNFPELDIRTPLIDRCLTKQAVLEVVRRAGLTLPVMYGLGFHCNNCVPCVKAQSPSYWALIRREFPEQFARMAKLARELDVRLCRIDGDRSFIDEIPDDHPATDPIQPNCDFLCQIAEDELAS